MGRSNAGELIFGVFVFGAIGLGIAAGWRGYFARDAITEAVNRCELEANKIFALEMVKWVEEHHTDVLNPFRRQRDAYIETCVKKEGYCALGDDAIWPASRPWAFAPRDPVAKWIYDFHYLHGEHIECND